MSIISFEFEHGLAIGRGKDKEIYYDVELRELTAADVIDARIASERVSLVPTDNGSVKPVAYHSDIVMGLELLRRQVARIGDIQGPLELKQLRQLHLEDLELLQQKAAELDKAVSEAWGDNVEQLGRDDTSGNQG